ncbi:hypothetical protein CANARDRAFT_9971 [[Candida] arabinofermentans NRRL YB-2248]|uniref:OTU domain-containing protein n=1 Tax=[Candida] arabinofermentans NRRL YB-2248 TaxID=983967 RepID=A0A1E4SU19_9ASCO|nr:hypothetical protein CANARDRAFT_9971 [[Candida] arabinofermentans NRRL YB-2248]
MSDLIETEEQILARHKKEVRDLVATTTGMKKQASKSKKKEVMKKISELEAALKSRHQQELKALGNTGTETVDNEDEDDFSPEKLLAQLELSQNEPVVQTQTQTNSQPQQNQPKKKRNRQKEKLAKRDAEMKKMQEDAQKEANAQPDVRAMELNNIAELCKISKLKQHDITPDGHCLFASIADQLKQRHDMDVSVQELRTKAANHMRENPETYAPYLFDEKTMTMKGIEEYTNEIENTTLWGGDLEIMALSKEFDCPISVMMSGRASLRLNEEGQQPELKLVYYQHSFGLGEHYNSLRDLTVESI